MTFGVSFSCAMERRALLPMLGRFVHTGSDRGWFDVEGVLPQQEPLEGGSPRLGVEFVGNNPRQIAFLV